VACAAALLFNKYVKLASIANILIMGNIMVHFKECWFVVGGSSNVVEYNF